MKKILAILLAFCLLTGLAADAAAGEHPEGKPWVNPELPGNLPDERPAPEDHYYLYVNYDMHRRSAEVAEEGGSLASRTNRETEADIWRIVETGDSTEAGALRILSSLIMDTDRREREGLEPLMAYVRQVKAVKSVEELSALCRRDGFLFSSPYATLQLERSSRDPEKFAMQIFFREVMPRLQWDEDKPQPAKEEDWYDKKRVEEELVLLGWDRAAAKQLTERLARYELDRTACGAEAPDADAADSSPSLEKLLKLCTPLEDQLVSQGVLWAEGTVFETSDLPLFRYMQSQYRNENLEMFKAIVCLSMYRYAADYLDPATWAKAHDGEELSPRQAAYEYMTLHSRFLTEQAYADACVSPELRALIKDLTEECRQALADRMRRCEWLSGESRANAVKKIESMEVIIVTPEERTDYAPLLEALSAEGISLLQAAVRYDSAELQMMLRLAGQPYVRGHRFLSASSMTDANAIYEPSKNAFYIMSGILKPAFCDTSSREVLLATIGQTIAHEMSHGFDNNGVEHDWEGNNNCVLTEADHVRFNELAERMSESLSRIELADGTMLDGKSTFFEAAADLTGLKVVLDMAKKTEGFDYDLFFRTLARKFYRSFPTREEALDNYASDGHPAHFVRTNFIFAQTDEFYLAYPAVTEGTGMYVAPEARVSLW